MYFRYFVIFSPWKNAEPFIWTTWITITQGCIATGLVEIGKVVLENVIFKFRRCTFAISKLSRVWKRAGSFIWTNLNPLHQGCILARWFWRKIFLNFVNVFLLFRKSSPLGKGRGLSFEQTWIRFTQGCFVPSLVEIGLVVRRRRWKCEKFTTTTTRTTTTQRTTDKFWSEKLTWAFGSGELKNGGKNQ